MSYRISKVTICKNRKTPHKHGQSYIPEVWQRTNTGAHTRTHRKHTATQTKYSERVDPHQVTCLSITAFKSNYNHRITLQQQIYKCCFQLATNHCENFAK